MFSGQFSARIAAYWKDESESDSQEFLRKYVLLIIKFHFALFFCNLFCINFNSPLELDLHLLTSRTHRGFRLLFLSLKKVLFDMQVCIYTRNTAKSHVSATCIVHSPFLYLGRLKYKLHKMHRSFFKVSR